MEDEVFIIEDFSEKVELMRFYYRVIGDVKFLETLHYFKSGKGYGREPVCCIFANEFNPGDEEYFGETGVNFSLHPPMVEIEENAIVDYDTFYKHLKEASDEYLSRNPHDNHEVEACLKEIKNRFNIT